MMTPVKDNWELGVALWPGKTPHFGHDGVNPGFESFMLSYVGKGDGIVVLANGGDGRRIVADVVRAVATDYGWPEIAAPATEEKTLCLPNCPKLLDTSRVGTSRSISKHALRDYLQGSLAPPPPGGSSHSRRRASDLNRWASPLSSRRTLRAAPLSKATPQ
ncbi:MAG: hypothetical protein ACTHMG_06695 [Sphingomonas sp.]